MMAGVVQRLQLAIFFYQTNDALLSRLSDPETEIVKGVGPSPRPSLSSSRSHRAAPSVSQRSTRTDTTTDSADDNDDGDEDCDDNETDSDSRRVSTITLEDFEQGKAVLPHDEPQLETPTTVMELPAPELVVSSFQSWLSESELLALASRPVVDPAAGDDRDPGDLEEDPRAAKRPDARRLSIESSSKTATGAARDSESSVLSSIRRSFHDRFGSPKASEAAPRSPNKRDRLRSPTSGTMSLPTSPTNTNASSSTSTMKVRKTGTATQCVCLLNMTD
ncbi:hypothetical protein PINS_up002491 [Pythium insidiosum]|nr:hypothetical protein PINS_up002491 [Pythium insidiosum]